MKRVAIPQAIKLGAWRRVDPASIPAAQWPEFALKRQAVSMYIDGAAMKEIRLRTGIQSNEVNRLAQRFCSMDEEGSYLGERSLLKYSRTGLYVRRKPIGTKRTEQQGGLSGALNMLLSEHNEIEASMIEIIRTPGAVLEDSSGGISFLISKFYQALSKVGIDSDSWPFITKHKGRTTIRKYLKLLRDQYAISYIHAHGDQASIAHLATGTGHGRYIKAKRPFDFAQLDGHFIDAIFALRVEEAPGIYQWICLDRI